MTFLQQMSLLPGKQTGIDLRITLTIIQLLSLAACSLPQFQPFMSLSILRMVRLTCCNMQILSFGEGLTLGRVLTCMLSVLLVDGCASCS